MKARRRGFRALGGEWEERDYGFVLVVPCTGNPEAPAKLIEQERAARDEADRLMSILSAGGTIPDEYEHREAAE